MTIEISYLGLGAVAFLALCLLALAYATGYWRGYGDGLKEAHLPPWERTW